MADELAKLGVERAPGLDRELAAVREDQEEQIELAHAVIDHQFAIDEEWEIDP